jgi:hypothetical protein
MRKASSSSAWPLPATVGFSRLVGEREDAYRLGMLWIALGWWATVALWRSLLIILLGRHCQALLRMGDG